MCPCGKDGKQPPGMHQAEHCQQVKAGDSFHLLSHDETYTKYCALCWPSQYKEEMNKQKWVQRRTTEVIKGFEHHLIEEKLKEFSLDKLKKENILLSITAWPEKMNPEFSEMYSDRRGGNRHKLKHKKFVLDAKKDYYHGSGQILKYAS